MREREGRRRYGRLVERERERERENGLKMEMERG